VRKSAWGKWWRSKYTEQGYREDVEIEQVVARLHGMK